MTRKQLAEILEAGDVAAVPRTRWPVLGREFVETGSHATGLAGRLLVGRLGDRLVAVEEADDKRLAVRPFASRKAATAFVKERMAAYDRLWDG